MPYFFNNTILAALALFGAGVVALYYGYRRRLASVCSMLSRYARAFGIGALALGIALYGWEVLRPLTPERIVENELSKTDLPLNINELLRWETVSASDKRVTYVYIISKTPPTYSERLTLIGGLSQQITEYFCGDRLYRAALRRQIAIEFIYKFADAVSPPITISPQCAGEKAR